MTDINKLEELAKAASELFVSGPWYYNDPDRFSQGHGKFSETAVYAAGNAFPWRVIEVVGDDDRSVALAKLIAELRPEVVVSLISQYRRMEEALSWRPIETAPRDGTWVDLWVAGKEDEIPNDAGYRRIVGRWWESRGEEPSGWHVGVGLPPKGYAVSHWRPLPAPPALQDQDQ